MSEEKAIRVTKAAAEFNVSTDHIYETLEKNGFTIERKPTFKITGEAYEVLINEYSSDKAAKADADHLAVLRKRDNIVIDSSPKEELKKQTVEEEEDFSSVKLHKELDKIKEGAEKSKTKKAEPEVIVKPEPVKEIIEEPKVEKTEPEVIKAKANLKGPKVLDKIELEEERPSKGKKKKAKEEPVPEVKAEEPKPEVIKAEEPKTEETAKPKGKKKKKEESILEQKPSEPTSEQPTVADESTAATEPPEFVKVRVEKYSGPTIFGKIDLPAEHIRKKPVASSTPSTEDKKRKRKRKEKKLTSSSQPFERNRPIVPADDKSKGRRDKVAPKAEPTDREIQEQIKATLQRLSGQGQKSRSSKMRKIKREHAQAEAQEQRLIDAESLKKIKVTEFVSANDLARLMNLPVTQIISTCMSLGMFVSINQRLDAETITIVAGEFGYEVEFVSADVQEAISDAPDKPEDMKPRPPIITVMGHVDHGKTSLLDFIRKTNVIAGESGGITQHIGAYEVTLPAGQQITFLDTPGHEAFTAMRARGAKVTDVAIIVVAADDNVMPQTIEAINHAQAAGVPIVFAINKIDKPEANPDRIRESLSKMNILVEEWGGKYQTQEISAKKGDNVEKLLDKVLVEAELLELKANPERRAKGTIIESSLDKGRGYVTTMLVQTGTMSVGDVVLAGCYSGRVKALFNERGQRLEKVGPSTPVIMLGLTGSAQAGDQFNVMEDEREAREIANRRLQLQREQGIRTHKHITLDEIGRRLAIGNFKELNLIVKGDVDGSVEALSDSLLKLSNPEIQINVIHKSVGQISESDVLLASASNAIIIGFQVRPSMNARKIAEQEQIDIRFYSVIYDAINEVRDAMEGMLAPEYEDKIVCNVEVRETFKIPKAGTIAGCMVLDGKITRNTKVRIIRDGIVIHSGELASLKRFKDDVREVASGYECGLNINNYNDVQVGDIIEGYETIAVKRTLA